MRKMVFLLSLLALLAVPASAQLVPEVRRAADARDFSRGQALLDAYQRTRGVNPELILAFSWLARGAQSAQDWDKAEHYAGETRRLALAELQKRPLDAEPDLPTALGAAIEVHAQMLAARQGRSEALAFLRGELQQWAGTSIRTRIQKNVNLLNLQGKPAPPLEAREFLGEPPASLEQLRGKAVILFFWAHWCGDCKQQALALEQLQREFGGQGLVIVGPTQRYGYAAGGMEVSPQQELEYIRAVRERYYGNLRMAVPVSQENFRVWGSSSSPTLAVLDRAGLVQLYHPGRLSYEQLAAAVRKVL